MKSMTPVEKCKAVYEKEPCERSFTEDLEAHLLHGYVVSNPLFFAMGRPVDRDASHELIVNPWHTFKLANCWHLYLFSGALRDAFNAAPFDLPWCSYERENRLTIKPFAAIKKRCANC